MNKELQPVPEVGRRHVILRHGTESEIFGGTEPKKLTEGYLTYGDNAKFVSLVEREEDNLSFMVKNWKMLRQAGLPVPPTIRILGKNKLMVTNLRVGGAEMYGKALYERIDYYNQRGMVFYPRKIDNLFVDTLKTQWEAVKSEICQYQEMANKHGIVLPSDDAFELLVKPDGSWKLVLTDWKLAYRSKFPTEVVEKNKRYVGWVEEYISDIFDHFSRLRSVASV